MREICAVVPGPVSAETTATDHPTMLAEGRKLAKIAKNIAVKVPLTPDGLKTCKVLRAEGAMVNVTLCFSAAQAVLAAKAGATFISPFVGRLDDIAQRLHLGICHDGARQRRPGVASCARARQAPAIPSGNAEGA